MAINISAKKAQILIGGQDFSAGLIEVSSWSTNGIDQTGLVKTSATLILAEVRGLPSSIDDRINPLFNIGTSVEIKVAREDAVTLQTHPVGKLRILSAEYSYETRRQTVQLGCLISLLSFKSPTDPNKLNLETAKLTSRRTIVIALLKEAGITTIVGLPDLPYPLYYPFNISGSYLECCGRVLYASLHFGWIDSNEAFRIDAIALNSAVSFQLQIGLDELWYRRLNSAEAPREIIEVRGSRQVGEVPQYPIVSYSERYGEARFINPEASGGIAIYEQSRITESFGGSQLTKREERLEPIGLIIPNTKSVFKTSLIASLIELTTFSYENNEEGKLRSIFTQIYRPSGQPLKEFYEYLDTQDNIGYNNEGLILAESRLASYSYDRKDRVSKISTTIYKTSGELLSGLDTDWSYTFGIPPTGLTISEINNETWVRQSNNFWIHRVDNYKTGGIVNPGFFNSQEKPEDMSDELFEQNQRTQQLSLVPEESASLFERSNSGQTVPPATERKPEEVVLSSESVCGKVIFSLYGGNPYKEKERSYSVEYLGDRKRRSSEDSQQGITEDEEPCDNEQAKAIASLEGALLTGRFKGQDIGVDIKDELFNWRPLQVLDCIEPDKTIRRYALDDSHWYIGQNRAIANFGCIWLGDVRNGNLAKPYAIALSLTGTLRVGGSIESYPYSLISAPYSLTGGMTIGGGTIVRTVLELGQIAILGGLRVGGFVQSVTTIINPAFSISAGIITGGEILSYQSLRLGEFSVSGGVNLGGNIIAETSLNPGQLGVSGGLSIGGLIETFFVTSQPNIAIRGGILVGGNIFATYRVTATGGISIGGNITRLGVEVYWNDLTQNQWNDLNTDDWNTIN